ncbi:hypothetical protein F5Y18DRAFT_421256 [Xylariaceae sp. FL1019]|nr:hypothetical protein F5Y18DRAFT_421256 [Xylariaceae sp. FL1019]
METSSRRKACDLCFKKKIRCDSLKPSCSNCSLYNVPCKTTTIRRRPQVSQASVPVTASEPKSSNPIDDTLDTRLARIEAKLDGLKDAGYSLSHFLNESIAETSQKEKVTDSSSSPPSQSSGDVDWISPRSRSEPLVPPIAEVLPIIEAYFRDYNSLIPLFDQQSFMRMFNDYYSRHGETLRIYAAVINVVAAMGYRVKHAVHGDARRGFAEDKIKRCVDNAQMMLDELMTRDQDTLGLQALLGLVILFQTHPDQTASSVLLSAAVRLAHSMRLESKTLLSGYSPQEARQRKNIFWVCYWLDKDISLRTVTPSLQVDDDIDIDLPGSDPDDNYSFLSSKDGLSQLNFFRAKVQLGHIEGKIYDSLLSNRSRKLSPEARKQAVIHIDTLLERWKESIPTPLHITNMADVLLSSPLIHMTVLYQTYLLCMTMLHGLYSPDAAWLKALGGLGSDLIKTFAPRNSACLDGPSSSSPIVLDKCVKTSRGILNLLVTQPFGGCSVWLSSCVYFSALTFTFVNLIYHPTLETAQEDQELAKESMLRMETYFDYRGFEKFRQLRHVLIQLQGISDSVIEKAKNEPLDPNSKYPWFMGFLPSLLPPGDIFDTSFDDLAQQPQLDPPHTTPDWMGAANFDTHPMNWPGASSPGLFFGGMGPA